MSTGQGDSQSPLLGPTVGQEQTHQLDHNHNLIQGPGQGTGGGNGWGSPAQNLVYMHLLQQQGAAGAWTPVQSEESASGPRMDEETAGWREAWMRYMGRHMDCIFSLHIVPGSP